MLQPSPAIENQRARAVAMPSARFLRSIVTKVSIFCLACVIGWAVAWIINQTILLWHAPTSRGAANFGADLRRALEYILNALYR